METDLSFRFQTIRNYEDVSFFLETLAIAQKHFHLSDRTFAFECRKHLSTLERWRSRREAPRRREIQSVLQSLANKLENQNPLPPQVTPELHKRCESPENFCSSKYFLKTVQLAQECLHFTVKDVAQICHRRLDKVELWLAKKLKPQAKDRTKFLLYLADRIGEVTGEDPTVLPFNEWMKKDPTILYQYMTDLSLSYSKAPTGWEHLRDGGGDGSD